VVQLLNPFARIPLCGLIAQYNATGLVAGPNWRLADCTKWVREGALKYREDIVEDLENAPRAFIGLLEGKNFGKLLVRVGEGTSRR